MMFTPANTRATLARLGVKTTYELGNGETFELGPKQLPGEAEWRADWLSWQRDLLHVTLVDTPEESRNARAQLHYRLLVNEIGLHPYEAQAVVGWAMDDARATMTSHAGSPRGPLMHMKGLSFGRFFSTGASRRCCASTLADPTLPLTHRRAASGSARAGPRRPVNPLSTRPEPPDWPAP